MSGKVHIVGAGPGSTGLLTLRAAEALRAAQVVLHDDLVSAEVLELCPPAAQIVNVGKRCGRNGSSQEHINRLMVDHARQGRRVVRLKSGDPSVFGRLGEELDALRDAEIPFEVIPGVTAAAAAAAAAGITLTDRRTASSLMILTGHSAQGDGRAQGDAHAPVHSEAPRREIDPERTTYAVYMPGPDYGRTARDLISSGIDPATPCVLVSHAGRATEQVRFLSVEGLGAFSLEGPGNQRQVAPPAVLIVGRVAQRDEFSEILKLLAATGESVQSDDFSVAG